MTTRSPSPPGAGARPAPSRRPVAPPPLGPLRRAAREVGLGLITAGVIVLLFVAYQLFGTNIAAADNQHQLAQAFQHALAQSETGPAAARPNPAPPAPAGPGAPVAGAIDHLVIPAIGVDRYVVQGVNEAALQHGPGHYPETVMPGQVGNAGIAGHRTTYGAPFFRLDELRPGDRIEVTNTAGRHFTYLMQRAEIVDPTDVAVLANTPRVAELTLTTCNPRFEATSRLVVVARLTANTRPLPPSPPASASLGTGSPALSLGQGNPSAWPAVAGFAALTLAAWVLARLAINRTRRWRRLGAYVVGIAVSLVPLWFLFENVTRLLPANI